MKARWILEILRRAEPYAVPETSLRIEIRALHGQSGETELAERMRDLERKGLVECEVDELTEDKKWKITPKGMLTL